MSAQLTILSKGIYSGKDRQIVIDPNRSFGKPIVNIEGVPAKFLFEAYNVEKIKWKNKIKRKTIIIIFSWIWECIKRINEYKQSRE